MSDGAGRIPQPTTLLRRRAILEAVIRKSRSSNVGTIRETLELAVEIAREGREGRRIGTLFVIGDVEAVLRESRTMILDPLAGHPPEKRRLTDPALRETVKELAQLDGGFIVSEDGFVISATRFFNADIQGVQVHSGLGSRHIAAASITRRTRAFAVVVSESAVVRLFDGGRLVAEVLPELYLLSRYTSHLRAPALSQHRAHNMAIMTERPRRGSPGPETEAGGG